MTFQQEEEEKNGDLTIDSACCIGCGLCTKIAPDNFRMESKKAVILQSVCNESQRIQVLEAMEKCPARAIQNKAS